MRGRATRPKAETVARDLGDNETKRIASSLPRRMPNLQNDAVDAKATAVIKDA